METPFIRAYPTITTKTERGEPIGLLKEKLQNNEWNERIVYAIIMAESGGNPKAYNPEWHFDRYGNPICQGSFGKWQLACLHGTPEELYDPVKSDVIAYRLWQSSGFYPWTTYTSKKYLEFLY